MGRLCQCIGVRPQGVGKRVDGTDTFHVIYYDDIPSDRRKDVTYTSVVCEAKPHKADLNQTRIIINLAGIFGNISATCRTTRHMLRISERHPKCRDILGRMSVFRRCQDVGVISVRA